MKVFVWCVVGPAGRHVGCQTAETGMEKGMDLVFHRERAPPEPASCALLQTLALRCVAPWAWAWGPVLCVFSFLYLKPELDPRSSEAGVWEVLSVTAPPLMGPVFMAFWDNDNFLSLKFIPCSPCAFSCSDFPARLHQMLLLDEKNFFSWNLRIPPPKSSRETPVTLCLEMALNRILGPKHKTLGQPYHSIEIL